MKKLALATALILATLAGMWLLKEVHEAVLIFFLSLGTSAALRPTADWLTARGLPKPLSLGLTYLACLAIVILFILALAYPLASDVRSLAEKTALAYRHIEETWPKGNTLMHAVAKQLPPLDELETVILHVDGETLGKVLGLTWGFVGILLHVVVIFVLSLYWSVDRVHFERLWLSVLDVRNRQRAREMWRAVEQAAGTYLQREAGQSLTAGLLLFAGFSMLGQPYPVLCSLIGALAWLFPYVGAFLAMICVMTLSLPTAVVEGSASAIVNMGASAIYTLIVLLVLEFFVEPRLFSHRRYNPILLLLVAIGMAQWLGFIGLLIAPVLAAAIQIVGDQYLKHRTEGAAKHLQISPELLVQRLASLKARLADMGEPTPEVKSLMTRLETLVAQTHELLAATNGDSAPRSTTPVLPT